MNLVSHACEVERCSMMRTVSVYSQLLCTTYSSVTSLLLSHFSVRLDGSPPGSPVPGILQARTLEWVAISFSSA